MAHLFDIFVPGIPVPQGSKTPWGTEANPQTRPWRATLAWYARKAWNAKPPMSGPLYLVVEFFFPRPKSHYRTGKNAGKLKPTAPRWKPGKPDGDKLQRAVQDALVDAGVIRDDALFVAWHGSKEYADQPGVKIIVTEEPDNDPPNT